MQIETKILAKNPKSMIRALAQHAFLCIVANEHVENIEFNKTMIACALNSSSISKIANYAKSLGLSDATHTIVQVCPSSDNYQYSIDRN